jgi:hypothetical protein
MKLIRGYYEATVPLSHRDVATLRTHHWISLQAGPCRMWWQGGGFLMHGNGADLRVPYDTADPSALAALNAAWERYKKGRE